MALQKLSDRLAKFEISSFELVKLNLDRIDTYDSQLQAFTHVFSERALAAAKDADERRARGQGLGPLDGLTFAVKDLFHIQGYPTHAGTRSYVVPPEMATANAVSRLEDAGMIALGKTRMDEFAYGAWGVNSLTGSPWNPWDLKAHRIAGGSSSGSAVAVAAGLAPAALGSDTGASCRVPAAFCGCVGLRPSFGAINIAGAVPLSPSLDAVGLLTHSVEDAELLFDVLSDRPNSVEHYDLDISQFQIGRLADHWLRDVASDVLAHYDKTFEILADLGASIVAFEPPRPFDDFLTDTVRLVSAEIFRNFGHHALQPALEMQPFVRERILAGKSATDYQHAKILARREQAVTEMTAAMAKVDAIVTPTCPATAIPISDVDVTAPATPFARFVNYLDLAALSLPSGLADNGLPVGMQIVVPKHEDRRLFQIGKALQKVLAPLPSPMPGHPW